MLKHIGTQLRRGVWAALGLIASFPLVAEAQGWNQGRMNSAMAQLPGGSIYDIIRQTMNWLLAILGFIAIIGFVISGIMYLTSAGDEGQIDRAKTGMKYSIIGVIVALMGFVIVLAVEAWLTGFSSSF